MRRALASLNLRSAGIGAGAVVGLIVVVLAILSLITSYAPMAGSSESFGIVNQALDDSGGASAPSAAAPMAPGDMGGVATGGAQRIDSEGGGSQAQGTDAQGFARLVIKTAELSMEVPDVVAAEAALRQRASALQGFVVESSSYGSGAGLTARIVFRVPSERFDEALAGAEGLADRVTSRSVAGQDVTEEFVDLESRLRNLEASRDRLRDLLAKATRVSDAVEVNAALSQVQGEIELIQGRMRYLQQSANLSTVTVNLYPIPSTPIIDEESWRPLDVARRALRDLVEFGQGLVELAIIAVIWLPVWGSVLGLALWLWRRWRARRKTA